MGQLVEISRKEKGIVTTDRTSRRGDASERAWSVVQEATGQAERAPKKAPAAVAGGLARAEKLTAERRLEIAKNARASRKESA